MFKLLISALLISFSLVRDKKMALKVFQIITTSLFLPTSGQEQGDGCSSCSQTDRDEIGRGAGGLHGGDRHPG